MKKRPQTVVPRRKTIENGTASCGGKRDAVWTDKEPGARSICAFKQYIFSGDRSRNEPAYTGGRTFFFP